MFTSPFVWPIECYQLIKSDFSSLDFVITRVSMKLFKSANVCLINDSRLFFKFLLPRKILEKKENKNFSITLCAVPTYYVILA